MCFLFIFLKEQIVFKFSFYFFSNLLESIQFTQISVNGICLTWNMLKCSTSQIIKLNYTGSYDVSREHTGLFGLIDFFFIFT